MKKILLCLGLLSAGILTSEAQTLVDGNVQVSNLEVANNDGTLFISMNLTPNDLKVKSNQKVVFTPLLVSGNDTLALPDVRLAGRNRYYMEVRNAKNDAQLNGLYRVRNNEPVEYHASVPFEPWMQRAELMMRDNRCGCLNEVFSENDELLTVLDFAPRAFQPDFVYLPPQMSRKDREVCGSAYIDFPVNRFVINEGYRNNRTELEKIFATIDSVKNDPDATINNVTIKGYASPEGSYKGNAYLAEERTKALVKHVQNLYSFKEGIISHDSEPEDWAGLRKYVAENNISHQQEILDIIDGSLEPDPKEWKLKSTYPEEYKALLRDIYPALRHSDYTVHYVVRNYTDVEEAKRVLKTRPGNLSLYEFYMIASTYEEGSEAYNDVFDTMVRVYPQDQVANLNAANVAMSRGDKVSARKFLSKAGGSAHAEYARGILEALERNFDAARQHFKAAKDGGIAESEAALSQLEELQGKK